jgi:hypothetical protein
VRWPAYRRQASLTPCAFSAYLESQLRRPIRTGADAARATTGLSHSSTDSVRFTGFGMLPTRNCVVSVVLEDFSRIQLYLHRQLSDWRATCSANFTPEWGHREVNFGYSQSACVSLGLARLCSGTFLSCAAELLDPNGGESSEAPRQESRKLSKAGSTASIPDSFHGVVRALLYCLLRLRASEMYRL